MVSLQQVVSFPISSTIDLNHVGLTQWSTDNQICFLSKKSVLVLELLDDPTALEDFAVERSSIPCPPAAAIPSLKNVLNSLLTPGDKSVVFQLLRDRIIAPRGYEGAEYSQFIKKANWSPCPVSVRESSKPKCILAALTTSFQLKLYGKTYADPTERRAQEKWIQLVDISDKSHEAVRGTLTSQGVLIDTLKFNEYKEMMYKATCVDFTWMPLLDNPDASPSAKAEAYLITAQANGDILIWHVQAVSVENDALTSEDILLATLEHGKLGACPNQIVSTMKFHWVNDRLGLLAVGTNKGTLSIFRVVKDQAGSFTVGDPVSVMDEDDLQIVAIDWLSLTQTAKSKHKGQKSVKLNLVIVKHPNYVLETEIMLAGEEVSAGSPKLVKIPNGPIVGVAKYSNDRIVFSHQSGAFSSVNLVNSVVSLTEDTTVQITPDSFPVVYGGLCFSPNNVLACVGRQLNCQFHPVRVKEPSRLLILSSLFGPDCSWQTVKNSYALNNRSLIGLTDVLSAFRLQLKTKADASDLEFYTDGQAFRQMTIEQLRLQLWVTKCISSISKGLDDEEQIRKENVLMLRRINIENHIMQRYFSSLIEDINRKRKLPKYQLSQQNMKSLNLIQKFMSSRSNAPKLPAWATTAAEKGSATECPHCPSVMDFYVDEDLGEYSESVEPGFFWNSIRCVENGHTVSICVLSLLPVSTDYKSCRLCNSVASMEPSFGQAPMCPFCEIAMEPPAEYEGDGGEFTEGMEVS